MLRFLLLASVFTLLFAAILVPRRGVMTGALWAVPLGVAMAIAVRMIWSPATRRDVRLLKRAEGVTELPDGRMVAVCGVIEPRGSPLRSPIHGEEVVAYQYQMYHTIRTGRKSTRRVVDYSGFGIVPAAVKSTYVTAKLGAFPALHDFGKLGVAEAPSLEQATRYLRSARFDPVPPGEMIEWVEVMDKPWNGRRAFTVNFRRAEGYDPAKDLFWEQRVRPGTTVCAIGTWSQGEGALVATKDEELRLFHGTAEEVSNDLQPGLGVARGLALLLTLGCVGLTMWLRLQG